MKRSLLVFLSFVAACGGVIASDDSGAPTNDGGIVPPPNKDGGPKPPPPDAAPPPPFDAQPPIDVTVIDVGPPCPFTMCNGECVDTSSDPNNCGGCNITCGSGTCVNSMCTTTTNEPPQGSCAHSLCDNSTNLKSGCDPVGCTAAICATDSYCCTAAWDTICIGEVASYCNGYSCP